MLVTGPGEKGEAIANAVAGDKSLGSDKGPKPGEGPSREERENGFTTCCSSAPTTKATACAWA